VLAHSYTLYLLLQSRGIKSYHRDEKKLLDK
jgi:hypothetical protein